MTLPETVSVNIVAVSGDDDVVLMASTRCCGLGEAASWALDNYPDITATVYVTATTTWETPDGDHAPLSGGEDAWLAAFTPTGGLTPWVPTRRVHPSYGAI